jgi:hypothetical protein
VERAGDGPDRRIGNAGVKRGGVELGVAEERLDHANDDVIEKVGGESRRVCSLKPRTVMSSSMRARSGLMG